MPKTLTVITPAYNRAPNLKDLYGSLLVQTCHEFEWLIVDDSSTDNTEEVVAALRRESSFPIRYLKKVNGGKHTALNLGIRVFRHR